MTARKPTAPHAEATVLAVDDLPEYLDLYEFHLGGRYDLRTATDGESALAVLDDDVDVALIDRQMPDLSGDEVLERVREVGYDCRVAFVSAVEPGRDVLEMGFDTYLLKPVTGERLIETVERLLRRARYDDDVQELYALCSKRAVLDVHDGAEYPDLDARIEELRQSVDHAVAEFSSDDYLASFYDLPRA